MFGWRKRKDGFEWREYVRTTILVRRRNRRERLGEAGLAAVQNLKVAGQRGAAAGAEGAKVMGRGAAHVGQHGAKIGVAGAKAVGRGAVHYGQQGALLGVEGARIAGSKLRRWLPIAASHLKSFGGTLLAGAAYAWAVLRAVGLLVADYSAPLLAPVGKVLRQPNVSAPLAVAGGVALLGGVIRLFVNGLERDTWIALLIGVAIIGMLLAARWADGAPAWIKTPLRKVGGVLGRLTSSHSALAATAVLAVIVVGGVLVWRVAPVGSGAAPRAADLNAVEGRAFAVSGDTLRVATTTVRLSGIEAPERDQTCISAEAGEWPCGQSARAALARLVRSGRVYCNLKGTDDQGWRVGDCRLGDADIAAELVRGGHVFASTGLFAPYGGIEREAKGAKAGIWAGEAARPSDYRAQKWEEAKRAAPDGCPIKGNVRGGRRVYIVPWSPGYERVKVSRSRGERWFCSESEAQEAGFKPYEQS